MRISRNTSPSRTNFLLSALALALLLPAALPFLAVSYPHPVLMLGPLGVFLLVIGVGALSQVPDPSAGASDDRPTIRPAVWVLALTTLAFLLRARGLSFGLPHNFFHPDEVVKANVLESMLERQSLSPRYFLHPTLLLYLALAVHRVLTLLNCSPFIDWDLLAQLVISGRIVSLLAGTLSIPLLYLLASTLLSRRIAYASSFVLAVAPLSVTLSRYFKEDTLLVFSVLLCLCVLARAIESNRPRLLPLAGLLAGFAASSKYPGVFVCLLIAMSPWLRSRALLPDRRFLRWGVASAFLVLPGFLICTPYAAIDTARFKTHVHQEEAHMRQGHGAKVLASHHLYLHTATQMILLGITPAISFLSLLGLGIWLRERKSAHLLLLAGFVIFYAAAESTRAKNMRYAAPCIPFLAIAAATALDRVRDRKAALAAAALLLVPLGRTYFLSTSINPDSRERMAAWISERVPPRIKDPRSLQGLRSNTRHLPLRDRVPLATRPHLPTCDEQASS